MNSTVIRCIMLAAAYLAISVCLALRMQWQGRDNQIKDQCHHLHYNNRTVDCLCFLFFSGLPILVGSVKDLVWFYRANALVASILLTFMVVWWIRYDPLFIIMELALPLISLLDMSRPPNMWGAQNPVPLNFAGELNNWLRFGQNLIRHATGGNNGNRTPPRPQPAQFDVGVQDTPRLGANIGAEDPNVLAVVYRAHAFLRRPDPQVAHIIENGEAMYNADAGQPENN